MTNRVGQQLGNYRLTQLLGTGGFADVYLGEHVLLGTPAAIKISDVRLQQQEAQKFHEEARTIARLIHPHIIRLLEFGLEGNTPFMVMDYAPNGTLNARHPKGMQLPLPTVVSYVKPIADALQFAHDEKYVHRDIKPENMLIGRRNEILLSDFGIAVIAHSTLSRKAEDLIGTPAYMAPEQIQKHPLPASDQYALGVMVYQWLTGTLPFEGTTVEIFGKHLHASPPPLSSKIPLSPEVEQVVLKALAKEPKQRFARIQDFAQALEQASQPQQSSILTSAPNFSLLSTSPLSTSSPPLNAGIISNADIEHVNRSEKNVYTPKMQKLLLNGSKQFIWKQLNDEAILKKFNGYFPSHRPVGEKEDFLVTIGQESKIFFPKSEFELADFTFQANLQIAVDYSTRFTSSIIGLVFRFDRPSGSGYQFGWRLNTQPFDHHDFAKSELTYGVGLLKTHSHPIRDSLLVLESGESLYGNPRSFYQQDENYRTKPILIAVVAQGATLDFYANLQHLIRLEDNRLQKGLIGIHVSEYNVVILQDTKIWIP